MSPVRIEGLAIRFCHFRAHHGERARSIVAKNHGESAISLPVTHKIDAQKQQRATNDQFTTNLF
jgi:hypothetical protein